MSFIGTTALILALSVSLLAQTPENPGQNGRKARGRPNAARMDTDKDGRISSSEWKGSAEMFARLDSNHDGYITREEMKQNRPKNGDAAARGRRNPRAVDANKDGQISRDEWKGPSEVFERLDANHDGFITRDERRAASRRGQTPQGQDQNQR
jgi:Ca2+-binding EF-hand superfamily protein